MGISVIMSIKKQSCHLEVNQWEVIHIKSTMNDWMWIVCFEFIVNCSLWCKWWCFRMRFYVNHVKLNDVVFEIEKREFWMWVLWKSWGESVREELTSGINLMKGMKCWGWSHRMKWNVSEVCKWGVNVLNEWWIWMMFLRNEVFVLCWESVVECDWKVWKSEEWERDKWRIEG